MPMEGSSEEYEKLALAALKKAASADSDPTYHNTRAAIFAYLAQAAASSEMAESMKVMAAGGGGGMAPSSPSRTTAAAAGERTGDEVSTRQGSSPSNGSTPGMAIVPRASD